MAIDLDDSTQLLAEIDRFARKRIALATARPESAISVPALEALTLEAVDLGILSPANPQEGYGLWEHVQQAQAMAFNTGALSRIAYANAGVAFVWHRMALAHALARELALELSPADFMGATLVSTGHYGLARTSLARWLKGVDQSDDETTLLADWLNRQHHATTLYAPQGWSALLWPVWQDGEVRWQVASRSDLHVTPCPGQHGFDEISGYAVRATATTDARPHLGGQRSRLVYQRMLKMDMIGLLAIAHGALLRGQEMASAYALIRKQGGKSIGGHSAVQILLAEIEMARHQAEAALAAMEKPLDTIDLGAVAAARIGTHDALCHAANQVMQVHGGAGYMRDTGPEKIVRDQNMLKLQAGGTRDAHLFVAGWIGEWA